MEASHRERLADLERATREKVELLTRQAATKLRQRDAGDLEPRSSSGATEQITKLAGRRRGGPTTRAPKGELSLRAAEIKDGGRADRQAPRAGRQAQVEQLEAATAAATHATVRQMFESYGTSELGKLRMETGALVSALKRPQVRGSWGEIQLKNVVRIAGMTDHVDFHAQATIFARRRRGRRVAPRT